MVVAVSVWEPAVVAPIVRIAGVTAVVRVSAIISSGEWETYSYIPKDLATPRIVSMSINHNRLAITGLDNTVFGKRRRRPRQCGNGCKNEKFCFHKSFTN